MLFTQILQEHARSHPSAQAQDMIKLCYQAAFGAEHLIEDFAPAEQDFMAEWERAQADDFTVPLYEWISPDYARLNLAACKTAGLRPETIFQLFKHSAEKNKQEHPQVYFRNYIDKVRALTRDKVFSFSESEWLSETRAYLADGLYPVRHSKEYNEAEKPSYRLISKQAVSVLRILFALNKSTTASPSDVRVIAIDGRAASGKSTLAALLAEYLNAGVIHTDDFFLPQALRTDERLNMPGGNVHFERIFSEVMPYLRKKEGFAYRCFDCTTMALADSRHVAASPYRIVEGAYSLHPLFGDYADLSIFIDINNAEQLRRISERDGEAAAAVFAERWIPLEEKYIEYYALPERCELVLDADEL